MPWLCGCGSGNLCDEPPEFCPLCGFPLWAHFGIAQGDEDDSEDVEIAG